MKLVYKILRFIFVTLLLVVPVAAVMLYVVLSIPGIQRGLCSRAEKELTELLGVPVDIGSIQIAPFNRVTMSDAVVHDQAGKEALRIGHLGAGISLTDLLLHGRMVVSYTELIDFHLCIYRDSIGGPVNVAPILERLKGKNDGEKKNFELAVNTIIIRQGSMTYDVIPQPMMDSTRFDPNHIAIEGFRADITVPRISSDGLEIEVKRLAAEERSGLSVDNLRLGFATDADGTWVNDMRLDMGKTHVFIANAGTGLPLMDMNGRDINDERVEIITLPGTVIVPGDFAPLVPQLAGIDDRIVMDLNVDGMLGAMHIKRLTLDSDDENMAVNVAGVLHGLPDGASAMNLDLDRFSLNVGNDMLISVIDAFVPVSEKAGQLLANAGNIDLLGKVSISFRPVRVGFNGSLACEAGAADIDAVYGKGGAANGNTVEGRVEFVDFDIDALVASNSLRLTRVSGIIDGSVAIAGADSESSLEAGFTTIDINDYVINGLTLDARMHDRKISADVTSTDVDFGVRLNAACDLSSALPVTKLVGQFDNVDLSAFVTRGLLSKATAGLTLVASVTGNHPDNMEGMIKLSDMYMVDKQRDRKISLDLLTATLQRDEDLATLNIEGDFVEGIISGRLVPSAVAPTVISIFSNVFPALSPARRGEGINDGNGAMAFGFTLKPDSSLCRYFNIPVEVIDDARVWGAIDNDRLKIDVNLEAPYLWRKGKLIENTSLSAELDGIEKRSFLRASSTMPSKYGPMTVNINSDGGADNYLAGLRWHIDAPGKYDGALRVNTKFYRDSTLEEIPLCSQIDVLDSRIVFNDTVWDVAPSAISLTPGRIAVDNFHIGRQGQQLDINGTVTSDSTDILSVGLKNIDLGYIFETLGINHVTFGGIATGNFYASQLFKENRSIYTPDLNVKGFSYNGCVLGDAQIQSEWIPATQGISIVADITDSVGNHTVADGVISPIASELDFSFDAQHLPVGFLNPFMEAFAEDVTGRASGRARLFGTFHDINLSGRLLAEDLSLRVKFTNTVYSVARDSVIIIPGRIAFDNILLRDRYDNTALLTGELTHNYFHDASFRFDVTDAHDLLCYDISERMTADSWYGRVFGSGGVTIIGIPGMINIGVNLATAPHTVFTLKLDDSRSAEEYDFITFHDRDKARKDSIAALDPLPIMIRDLRNRRNNEEVGPPTEYVLDFNLDVTPAATLNIIMDPVSGDKISAVGYGHMRMNYASTGDFKIFGNYNIERGSYNFTLQDIILKDFTLVDGSSIKFSGNPDAAQLDLKATYTVNANLTDLDESFSQDKELNRTNVPVNAVLLVKGDMRQPDIDFDLEFPTLTRDVDRKVRSIVSTEEMMNRQIIYLLALNRFYTPDYMNATRGNELVSVASSTISSQLSSMLGQLSDKWSIAPNFRSDRGDFSDVEVDVALSSHLLNNRLLLNGNFGYRDKSLNNNSFIGDFDIRYLLNRTGTISLKAYNRYNDQNYYLKSALTTQGIGVVFKRDFDSWLEFLNPFRKKKETKVEARDEKTESTEKSEDSGSLEDN